MKIIGIGQTTLDKSYVLSDFPLEDSKVESTTMLTSVGGPVASGLLLCRKFGHDCELFTQLGDDQAGLEVVSNLHEHHIQVISQKIPQTLVHTYLVNQRNGTRTGIKSFVKKSKKLKISLEAIASADVLLLDRHHISDCSQILQIARKNTIIIMDPSTDISPEVLDLTKKTTIPVLPVESIKRLFPATALKTTLKNLKSVLGETYIITVGSLGSLLIQNSSVQLFPSVKIKAVDALGAGDVYRAALALALAEQKPLKMAVQYANLVAAL
ncbi:MAG: PfkB family carbohydrate kinase [Microgenomates group bacterium]